MFVIKIEDLKMSLGDLNLSLKKNAIWFKLLAQKKETGKQITSALYLY